MRIKFFLALVLVCSISVQAQVRGGKKTGECKFAGNFPTGCCQRFADKACQSLFQRRGIYRTARHCFGQCRNQSFVQAVAG